MTAPTGPIIVPLDGSKNAEQALPMAALLARLFEASIRFVHVAEGERLPSAKDFDEARRNFAAYAGELAGRHGLAGKPFSADLLSGSPGPTILESAANASFIVLASHGKGGFHATFIGSVADKVVRGARVPVLVVPAIDGEVSSSLGTILVALDGSAEAEGGLRVARDIASRAGARVTLVRAYTVPPAVGVEFAYYPPDLVTSLEEGAKEYLAATAREGEGTVVALGSASEIVVQAATDLKADLVVMSSHGKGLAGRLALGSTTDRVMHGFRRPLLVVPAPRD